MKYPKTLGRLFVSALFAIPIAAVAGESADDSGQRQELEHARQELAAAAARFAELSREHGQHVVELRRVNRKRPMAGVVLGSAAAKGVAIQAVTPEGPAAKAGLRSGGVITRIDARALEAASAETRIADA